MSSQSLQKLKKQTGLILSLIVLSSPLMAIELYKGVVLDKNSAQAFIASPNASIQAIRIDSGKTHWNSDSAELPVLVMNSEIYSQAKNNDDLTIVKLSSKGKLLEKQSYALPKNTQPLLQETLETQFNLSSIPNFSKKNKDSAGFQWSYSRQAKQGMLSKNKPKPQLSFGTIEIPASSGLKSAKLKPIQKSQIKRPIHHESNFLGGVEGRQFKSISGEHILVSLHQPNSGFNSYLWSVYTNSGDLLGKIKHHTSFRPFEVINNHLLFVDTPITRWVEKKQKYKDQPLSLKAYSLNNSQNSKPNSEPSWKRKVRDFRYNGPMPH